MSTKVIHSEYLKVNGSDVSALALTSGSAVYSDAIETRYSNGFARLLVKLTGGSDDVDITYEVSDDGKTFYTPYDTDGNSLSKVFTTLTNALASNGYWIVFSPAMANYIRFKLDPDADSTITAKYSHQEE